MFAAPCAGQRVVRATGLHPDLHVCRISGKSCAIMRRLPGTGHDCHERHTSSSQRAITPDEPARRIAMRLSTLKIIVGCAAALPALSFTSSAAFAQGGGNGQGGSGGGNAHSAATAGMTHWGDPAPSPLDMMPGSRMRKTASPDSDMQSMSPSNPMNAAKAPQ